MPALDSMLDTMDAQIDDRRRQLTALQNLIMTRELARQIVPGGRPVESGYISSLYGQRTDPFDGNQASHQGIDFAGAAGTQVLAVADGIVSHTGLDGGYGRLIEITHGNGYVTRYAHNAKLLVKPGADREARRSDRAHGLDGPLDRHARAFRSAARRPADEPAVVRAPLSPPAERNSRPLS